MSGKVPEWARQDMRKSAGYGCKPGIKQMGNPFHGAKQVRHYADGSVGGVKADDEATLKQEGLDVSNKEAEGRSTWENMKAGFGRLFEGNIDDPGSEAYRKYGAGRGQRERDYNAAEKQMDALDSMRKQDAAKTASRESEFDAAEKQLDNLNAMKSQAKSDAKPAAKSEAPKKFGDAFSAARKSGAKTFEWNGKKYTTEVKGESKPAPKTTSAPAGEDQSDAETKRLKRQSDALNSPMKRNMGRAAARKRAE